MIPMTRFKTAAAGSLVVALLLSAGASAQTVNVPYQGWLTQDELPCSGTYSMVFALYNSPSSATEVWSDTYDVPVANGAFSVVLPVSEAVVFGNADLYLEITVQGVTLSNRQRIYPALYAKRNAPGGDFHVDANLGVGTDSPETRLQLRNCPDVSVSGGGCLLVGGVGGENLAMDNNEIMARNNSAYSTLYLNANGGDTFIGGGVGIGIENPQDALHVNGYLRLESTGHGGLGYTRFKGMRRTTFRSSVPIDSSCPDQSPSYNYCRQMTLASISVCYVMEVHGVICAIRHNTADNHWWLVSSREPDSEGGHQNQCVAGCLEWTW